MTIAEKKRTNNLAEYILYMFQTEDLIRAFEFDIERIKNDLVTLLASDDADKEEIGSWYETIANTMKSEGLEQTGHLEAVNKDINLLKDLFSKLKKKDDVFQKIVANAQPLFSQSSLSEVDTCLNGMYAYLILKTDDLPVPDITSKRAEIFGEVLSYLSYKANQEEYLSKN